jgi:hypothetical protein
MRLYINKILLLLYRFKILKIRTLLDRIKFLKLCNISLYEKPYSSGTIYSQEKDLVDYIELFKGINCFDLETGYYPYKPISTERVIKLQLYQWCSSSGKMLPNEREVFNTFLDVASVFVTSYEKGAKNNLNHFAFTNSHKLKPYIINLDYIAQYIVDLYLQKY